MSKNWVCKECSEKIDKEFDTCWNCGYSIIDKSNSSEWDYNDINENEINEGIYSDIKDFKGLHSYRGVLLVFIILNLFSGLVLIGTGIQYKSLFIIVYGSAILLSGCYYLFKQIQIVDFLFFLNQRIDKLEKKK